MPTTELPTPRQQADVRPLGYLAFGLGVLGVILAPTYFLSVYAYIAALPALVLGLVARREEPIRKLGTAAVALALVAALVASAVLLSA